MQTSYQTIAAATSAEFKDRGSKFLAYAYAIQDPIAVKSFIQQLKKEHGKAVHFCYAWRIGTDGTQFRSNDDGEPAGSAGKPILGQIDSKRVTNVCVIVVRYFGGTLLGVPGLINAYKTAAAMALEQSELVEKDIVSNYDLSFEYPILNEVMYALKQFEVVIQQQEMLLFCTAKIGIPLRHLSPCLEKLNAIHGLTITAATP